MTTVLIVDDHALIRDSLRRACDDAGFDVVGEAADGREAIDLADATHPDVVLMDVSMPVLDGIEATTRIVRRRPDTQVLILTMHADADLVAKARTAGARGYLLKDSAVDDVVAGLTRVAGGGTVMSSGISPAAGPPPVVVEPETETLSAREVEVLQLLADGMTPAEVAKALFISPNTVRNHLARIYDKLDAHDRTQAVVEGLRRGVIRLQQAV